MKLGIGKSERVLLFLGNIRPYKGVEELIQAFKELEFNEVRLLIAGRTLNEDVEKRVRALADEDVRCRFYPGFVADEVIQVYMNAADVAVCPYKDILTSGAILLAMSFGKACVAPMLGCITDYLDERGAFLYNARDPGGLIGALKESLTVSSDRLSMMGEHNRRIAEGFSWDVIAQRTLDVYRGIESGNASERIE
jgi:glycosyltransferase involved in cell wall biosynthesis